MDNRSFMRLAAILAFAITVDALLAVAVYFTLVPVEQRLIPFAGAEAFLASLTQNSGSLQLYYFLYALNPVLNLLPITALYFRLPHTGETWSLFALLLGMIGAFFWMVFGFQQLEQFRYLSTLYSASPQSAVAAFSAPQLLNPFNGVAGGFISVWFLLTGLMLLKTDANKLLAIVAFIAFADLLVGFLAPLGGFPEVAKYTAGIAGAVGGPLFWILAGLDLMKHAEPFVEKQVSPSMMGANS
jgi:hypothetical protein